MSSPMRTTDQEEDPFAAFNASAVESNNSQFDDPWAAMMGGGGGDMPIVPMGAPAPVPSENPPPVPAEAPPVPPVAPHEANVSVSVEQAYTVLPANNADEMSEASAESIPVQNYNISTNNAPPSQADEAPATKEVVPLVPPPSSTSGLAQVPTVPSSVMNAAIPAVAIPPPATEPLVPPMAVHPPNASAPSPPAPVAPAEEVPATVVVQPEDANASPPSPISLTPSSNGHEQGGGQFVTQGNGFGPTIPMMSTTQAQQPFAPAPALTQNQPAAQHHSQATAPGNPFDFNVVAPAQNHEVAITSPVATSVSQDDITNQIANLSVQSVAPTAVPTSCPSGMPINMTLIPPSEMPPAPPSEMPPPLPTMATAPHAESATQPAMDPAPFPPSPPDVMNLVQHNVQNQQNQGQIPFQQSHQQPAAPPSQFGFPMQAPLSPVSPTDLGTHNADPFGYAFSPMTSPGEKQNFMNGTLSTSGSPPPLPLGMNDSNMNTTWSNNNGATNNTAMVPSTAPNADPWGIYGSNCPAPAQPQVASQQASYNAPPVPPQQPSYRPPPPSPPKPQYEAPDVPAAQQPYQPPVQSSTNALDTSAMPNNDPFGVGAPAPSSGAIVPSAAANTDPFGVFESTPSRPLGSNDPFGGNSFVDTSAIVPSTPAQDDDPFGIFGSPTPVTAPLTKAPASVSQAPAPTSTTANEAHDPWAAAGFGASDIQQATDISCNASDSTSEEEKSIELDQNSLPKAGEYYDARINAKSLGAMFYTARDLEDTLLYHMPTNVIDAMGTRPIVAYVAEDSAAENNGVHLGHCVLSVNGSDVSSPEECAETIRNCPRPMMLRCYVMPELELSPAEGNHMVKYDTKSLDAPTSSVEWKAKYVVVGGIIAKPWMLNMYYNKKDYDTAVKETHMNFKCSIKVKQFDLRGARIVLDDKNGKPNTIRYPSEGKVWYFITILPHKGYPIKISSETLDGLEPVYSATRRFIRRDMEDRYRYEEKYGAPTKHGYQSAYSSQNRY